MEVIILELLTAERLISPSLRVGKATAPMAKAPMRIEVSNFILVV
jgi:hypothetical protein